MPPFIYVVYDDESAAADRYASVADPDHAADLAAPAAAFYDPEAASSYYPAAAPPIYCLDSKCRDDRQTGANGNGRRGPVKAKAAYSLNMLASAAILRRQKRRACIAKHSRRTRMYHDRIFNCPNNTYLIYIQKNTMSTCV